MKKIFLFLFAFSMKIVFAQHNLTAAPWHAKVESALALIQEYEPGIYETIKTSYIQVGGISGENEMHAWAFARKEPRYNYTIPWIMLDSKALTDFTVKNIAGLVLHEALHLAYWDKGVDGKIHYSKSDADMKVEHTYIYNYQLNFLKKIRASKNDQQFCLDIMHYLRLTVYNN